MEIKIQNTERIIETGFITFVNYRIIFSDTNPEGKKFQSVFSSRLEYDPVPKTEDFIEYEDLELENIIKWVTDSIPKKDLKTISDYHNMMIKNQMVNEEKPKTARGLPPSKTQRLENAQRIESQIESIEQRKERIKEEEKRLKEEEKRLKEEEKRLKEEEKRLKDS